MEKEIMKKVFSILLIAVIIFSMTGVVAGEVEDSATSKIEYDNIDSNQATVSATVMLTLEELFTVTLPTSFVLELNDDKNAYADAEPLEVDIIRLDSDHSLEIYVSSANAESNNWRLRKGSIQNDAFVADDPEAYLSYSMGIGTKTSHVGETGNTKLVPTGSSALVEIAKEIHTDYSGYYIHVKTDIPESGSLDSAVYQDNLTFTVKLNTDSTGTS